MNIIPKTLLVLYFSILLFPFRSSAADTSFIATKQYLNLPVSHSENRLQMIITSDAKPAYRFVIRLASSIPDYWVFYDMTALKGKKLTIRYEGAVSALSQIYQADTIHGQQQLYKENFRPQFHFTSRRGWLNDPNGLVFYEGEYHLFYQHNPYERDWGNMHWGHAVSTDLIHWKELPVALFPDSLGMAYSGSIAVDYNNTAGFNQKNTPALVAAYTAANNEKQTQCIAYSLDKGRTWTKYTQNPVIDSKLIWNSMDTRDPRVFWYAPSGHWVLVLNERDGHSVYTSPNLKNWTYQSHTTGFWECPDLFELPVDGDKTNTLWVMYGASGTYMLGHFDGRVFTPKYGKYFYSKGAIYASQTFSNIPATDGRRIQIGWGRMNQPGMPFNQMMLLPTELTLRTTKNGIRLFSNPVKEVDGLQEAGQQWNDLSAEKANDNMRSYNQSDYLRIKTTIHLSHATSAGLSLNGQALLDYDLNSNTVNGVFYSPEVMTGMDVTADIIIDKTSIEVFIDGGAYSYSMERKSPNNQEGFRFWGNNIGVKRLEVFPMKSIWNTPKM